jgi:hypothetical protein
MPALARTEPQACRFTLRAIARIAQEVNKTTLKYD